MGLIRDSCDNGPASQRRSSLSDALSPVAAIRGAAARLELDTRAATAALQRSEAMWQQLATGAADADGKVVAAAAEVFHAQAEVQALERLTGMDI